MSTIVVLDAAFATPVSKVASTTPMWDLFLAHAGPDVEIARAIHPQLSDAVLAPGRRVRVFLDAERLVLGDRWDQALPLAPTGRASMSRSRCESTIHPG